MFLTLSSFPAGLRNVLNNCLLYLELYLSVLPLFSALLLLSLCFSSTCALITLLFIVGILPGLIFNCLAGEHQVSSTLLVPDAHTHHGLPAQSLFYYVFCGSELRCIPPLKSISLLLHLKLEGKNTLTVL